MQEMANTYGKSYAGLTQTSAGQYVVKCDSALTNVFFDYCKTTGLQCREYQEPTKSPLTNVWEKLTGKEINGARDITFEPIARDNVYLGEDR